jgi:neuronal calcium sensor 1
MASDKKIQKSDLSEDDIQFIIANTDFNRDQVIKWFEEFKKQCPSGRLNKQEFIKFYKKLIKGDHPDEEQFCAAVFDVYDQDGNYLLERNLFK